MGEKKKKTILGMNCSSRKMNSYAILKVMQEAITHPDFEMEIVNLRDYKINHCIGNCKCMYNPPYECIQTDDDLPALKEKFCEADGYVFAVPNYIYTVPGRLKVFMDRCCNLVHHFPFAGKYAAIVATSVGPPFFNNEDLLMELMRRWMWCLGICISGELSAMVTGGYKELEPLGYDIRVKDMPALQEKARNLAGKLVSDMIEKPKFQPEAFDLYLFSRFKLIASVLGGKDGEVFKERGWFEKEHWSL